MASGRDNKNNVDCGYMPICENERPTTKSMNNQQPKITNQQPTTNHCWWLTINLRPPPTTSQQPTTNNQPPTTNPQPLTNDHQPPTTNSRKPTTNHQQPTTSQKQPRMNDQQPTTTNHQWTTNQQPTVIIDQPLPTPNDHQLITNHHQPTTNQNQQSTNERWPKIIINRWDPKSCKPTRPVLLPPWWRIRESENCRFKKASQDWLKVRTALSKRPQWIFGCCVVRRTIRHKHCRLQRSISQPTSSPISGASFRSDSLFKEL